jgi:hypothetical protein
MNNSLVFVTRWSDYFEAPMVEVYANDRPERVTCAVPLNPRMSVEDEDGKTITDDTARKVSYASLVVTELKQDKYKLEQFEIDAIIEFLLQIENFSVFDSMMPSN